MSDKNHVYNMSNINLSKNKLFALNNSMEVYLCDQVEGEGSAITSLTPGMVHFLFGLNGKAKLNFLSSQYELPLPEGNYYFLYNPIEKAPFQLTLSPQSRVLVLQLDAKILHGLFMQDDSELSFLHGENGLKKYYRQFPIEPTLYIPLNQLFAEDLALNTQILYFKAKVLEILSICFAKKENPDEEACPFLKDTENVDKIKSAKRILIEQLASPPSLKELSKAVGLNEYNLKSGFKNVYGLPVMTWLTHYKLEIARKQLTQNNVKINELADQLGYNSPSHFIEAFKSKFGITPKKYQQSLH